MIADGCQKQMKILHYAATFPYSVCLFIILLSLRIYLLLSTFVRICDTVE